jgi:3-phenylpropionate/trans-cinnamate dioxygenase ferredoxin component
MSFVRVASEADLLPDTIQRIGADDCPVALVRCANGKIFAVSDNCTHEDTSLAEGFVEGERIECPRHGAQFELSSGRALTLPAVRALRTFEVKVENGEIYVNIT